MNGIKERLAAEFESYRALSMAAGRHTLKQISSQLAADPQTPDTDLLRMLDELVSDLKCLADDFGREAAFAINTGKR